MGKIPVTKKAIYRAMIILPAIFAGIAGCATTATHQAEDRVKTIWQAREQYVAIEKQDLPKGATITANAHPVDISADRLRDALESIEVILPRHEKTVPLFNGPELRILSEKISEGLAVAGPGEDVTFAVIGQYPTLLGLMRERKVTVGRVFCQDGRINIIFGDVLRDVKEDEDRRLYPFVPGSRAVAATGSWRLTKAPGGEPFIVKRADWLTFPLAGAAASVSAPASHPDTPGDTKSTAVTPAVSPGKQASPKPAGKTIEERLRILRELQNENLITDEEYRTKRREILKEL